MSLDSAVLTAVIAAIFGYGGSWLNWSIEQRRHKRNRRAELVDLWRREILTELEGQTVEVCADGMLFTTKPAYTTLRPHLSDEFREKIEFDGTMKFVIGKKGNWVRRELMEEIGRIEKEWDLV